MKKHIIKYVARILLWLNTRNGIKLGECNYNRSGEPIDFSEQFYFSMYAFRLIEQSDYKKEHESTERTTRIYRVIQKSESLGDILKEVRRKTEENPLNYVSTIKATKSKLTKQQLKEKDIKSKKQLPENFKEWLNN